MKWLLVPTILSGLLCGCRGTDDVDAVGFRARPFSVNQPVAVRGPADTWNLGVITGVHRFLYGVLQGDGRQSLVVAGEMIVLPRSPRLELDDRVLACRDGARMYPGVVAAKVEGGFTVRWSDGSPPSEVPAGKIVRAPQSIAAKMAAEMADSSRFAVGTTVAAQWRNSWYIAVITGRSDGRFSVRYGDGDTGLLTAAQLIPTAAATALSAGDRVLACHNGPRMLFGVLVERTQARFSVRWDEGGVVSDVGAAQIVPAPATAPPAPAPAPIVKLPEPVPVPSDKPDGAGQATDSRSFTVGQTVAAMRETAWFLATIVGQPGDRYQVRYGVQGAIPAPNDDDVAILSARQILPMTPPAELARGERVLACCRKGPQMYFGTLVESAASTFKVSWEDGAPPSTVAANQVTRAPQTGALPGDVRRQIVLPPDE